MVLEGIKPNRERALMLAFYDSGDTSAMQDFLADCIPPAIIQIMAE